jgi:hypothetical protein
VDKLAIILDSGPILGFAIDSDGAKAIDLFRNKVIARLPLSIQTKMHETTQTKSAGGGQHWLFRIDRTDFPEGIPDQTYWKSGKSDHSGLEIIGSNQYIIERGFGYGEIKGIECTINLTKIEANTITRRLAKLRHELEAFSEVCGKLAQYWPRGERNKIVIYTAAILRIKQ